jgi:circadian clock protein KaiC
MTAPVRSTAESLRRVSTGVEGLDAIIEGGFPQGHLYLLEGETGTGKTTIGLQFLLEGARHGERGLLITLSSSQQELEEVAHSHGWSLASLSVCELLPSLAELQPEEQQSIFHPAEMELEDQSQAVRDVVMQHQPQRVVIDSLSELRLLATTPFLYRRQLLAWQQFFAERQCTVLLLGEHLGETTPGVRSLAHGVLSLEQVIPEYGATHRRLNVIKLRSTAFHTGYHDYSIRRGGVVVYPRLVAVEHQQDFLPEILTSGVAQLDALLGGGLDRGTNTLLTGPAGTGKSSLALVFAVAAAQRGEFAVIYSFEEGRQTLLARAAGLGLNLREHLEAGRVRIAQLDPVELLLGEFIHRVRRAVEQEHARVVIIDSLNGLLQAVPGEQLLGVQLHELLAFLNYQGVVTLMVLAHAGILGDSVRGPVNFSYLADTVLLLRYFETAGHIRKVLSVVKKRGSAHEQTIRELQLGPERIQVGEPLTNFSGVLTGVPTYMEAGLLLSVPK